MKKSLILFLLLPSMACFGWGAKGHRVTGAIAEQHLTAGAAAAVDVILQGESLAYAATWADDMRSATDNPAFWGSDYSANWHFINLQPGENYAVSAKNPAGDAWQALQVFVAILDDQPVPDGPVKNGLAFYFGDLADPALQPALKAFALRFVVHLVGDLHQPLHVGFADDLGGNRFNVRWFGETSNLHTVWDTRLVEYPGLSYTELVDKLARGTAAMADLDTNLTTLWLDEAIRLRDGIYRDLAAGANLEYDYTFANVPLVEQQMTRAGLRLAALLNAIFE